MIELFHSLSDWLIGFADSDWAIAMLAFSSFIESIFFPIPPDPLLLAVAIAQQDIAILLGVMVAVASVAGAVVGHALGMRLGRPILTRMFSETKIAYVDRLFERYGTWAILIAAFTPVPYKVFAIAAGVWRMDRRKFIIASVIGRGARFITIGVLVFLFGEEIEKFLSDNFEKLTFGITILVVMSGVAWYILHRRRRARMTA
jgi:membrane protein YqaA with SNARE-associated domain